MGEDYRELLKQVLNEERYLHSLGVKKASGELACLYGADKARAEKAGLLHDYGKQFSEEELLVKSRELGLRLDIVEENNPELLHASVGALLVKTELGIEDEDIIEAISCHTTGKAGMGRLACLVFLADFIEENRSFPGVEEIRELALKDLDKAILRALDQTINYVVKRGRLLHPDSINLRNEIIVKMANRNRGVSS